MIYINIVFFHFFHILHWSILRFWAIWHNVFYMLFLMERKHPKYHKKITIPEMPKCYYFFTYSPNMSYIYIYAFSRCFYPKRLTVAFRLYILLSVYVFPGNRTHNLLRCWRNALPLSHTGTVDHWSCLNDQWFMHNEIVNNTISIKSDLQPLLNPANSGIWNNRN